MGNTFSSIDPGLAESWTTTMDLPLDTDLLQHRKLRPAYEWLATLTHYSYEIEPEQDEDNFWFWWIA